MKRKKSLDHLQTLVFGFEDYIDLCKTTEDFDIARKGMELVLIRLGDRQQDIALLRSYFNMRRKQVHG